MGKPPYTKSPPVRPFLKWAGNKTRIIDRIKKHLPPGKRLVEAFAGSCSCFLNTDYEDNLICDTNRDLIQLYTLLQRFGESFIAQTEELFTEKNNTAKRYYDLRDEFNGCRNQRRRAAILVYLNKHNFNGLARYNNNGEFNVPFGTRVNAPRFPAEEMRYFHHKARNAEFRHQDFTRTFAEMRKADSSYCDPPYLALSRTANFTSYTAGGFSMSQQKELSLLAEQAARKGIPVLISNHNTPEARKLYSAATIKTFKVRRSISCKGSGRIMAPELLALYGC